MGKETPEQAPHKLPADVVIHQTLVVTRKSGDAILRKMKTGKANKTLRKLMGD
jgi:hypothetical protein